MLLPGSQQGPEGNYLMFKRLTVVFIIFLLPLATWSMVGVSVYASPELNVGQTSGVLLDSDSYKLEGDALRLTNYSVIGLTPVPAVPGTTIESANESVLVWLNQSPADDSIFELDAHADKTAIQGTLMAGKFYLWIAFIAAMVIFVAAVLGAILLYTRQRNKE